MNEEIYSVKSRALINSSECSKYLGQNLLQILNLQKSKNVYSALYSLIGWNLKMFTMHCTVYSAVYSLTGWNAKFCNMQDMQDLHTHCTIFFIEIYSIIRCETKSQHNPEFSVGSSKSMLTGQEHG